MSSKLNAPVLRGRMRVCTLLIVAMLAYLAPSLAQDLEYPTLDALAAVEIPTFDYLDMVGRMSTIDASYTPPSSPPDYDLGDTETFIVTMGADETSERVEMELRGQTQRVLIWIQATIDYPRWRAQALARQLENQVLNPVERLFQTSEPPGVDGDPRLYVVLINDPDGSTFGYFPPSSTRPKKLFSKSNQREMLVVDLSLDDEYDFFDEILMEVIAHEFLHILHFHSDPGEETWLDEGLASYAAYYASKSLLSRGAMHFDAEDFLAAPNTGLQHWDTAEEIGAKYGAGALFILYLTQRFGDDILARLLADTAHGWRSVDRVLREFEDASADEVFADWVLANLLLDYRRGYGYRALDSEVTPPEPVASLYDFPATHEGELPQLSAEYLAVDVSGADKLFLRLSQAPNAQLIPLNAPEGNHFAYGFASDYSNSRLTRDFALSALHQIWLEFRIWHDLDFQYEYGYVTISDDRGRTWQTLPGRYTTNSHVYRDYYDAGFTGRSGGWRREYIDLSEFSPGLVSISFELMSNIGTAYRGMAIDDVHIRALHYHEDFETPDDTWRAEGWIRTDNRLPNNTWLQVVQETRSGYQVSRALITGNGDLIVDILPGVSQALVAVSPFVPDTSMPAEYELGLYLVDAEGEIMVVTRDCKLTTTHGLNFRDAPDGNKIGLLPQGTAVWALDSSGDWFNVAYNGLNGWIHGGYVTTEGNCA